MTLQSGTGPGAKQPVPTTALYPADGLSSFAPVEQSYRRLHKAALILTGFGVTDGQLEWLSGDPPFVNLDALPMEAATAADAAALFLRWRQLAGLYAVRKKLPRSNVDLFDVFKAGAMPEAIERLVLATGWDRAAVEAFIGPEGFAIDAVSALRPSPEQGDEPTLLRLARAMEIQRRVGVAPATLNVWASGTPDADGAAAIVQAVKARYDETRWLEVAGQLNDPLRAERRDALVVLPAAADARPRRQEPQSALRVLPHRRGHEPLHAHVANQAGDRRGPDVLPALPHEPRAEGSAARDRRQRLEVDEELPRVGGEPEGLPLSRELDRAGAARRQVAALPGARAHDPAAGDQERQRRSGIRRLPRGARRNRAARRPRRLVRGTRHAPDGQAGAEGAAHPAGAPLGVGRGHVSRVRAHVQRAVPLVLPAAGARPHLDAVGEDRGRHRRRASRSRGLQSPDASVLDDVSRSEQEASRAEERDERQATVAWQGLGDPARLLRVRPRQVVEETDVHGRRHRPGDDRSSCGAIGNDRPSAATRCRRPTTRFARR